MIPVKPQPVNNIIGIGAGVGGLVTIVIWTLDYFYQVRVPADVGIAGTTFLTFVVQRLLPQQ